MFYSQKEFNVGDQVKPMEVLEEQQAEDHC